MSGTATDQDIVVVSDLVKRFGDNAAVDGVSFQIHTGEAVGVSRLKLE